MSSSVDNGNENLRSQQAYSTLLDFEASANIDRTPLGAPRRVRSCLWWPQTWEFRH